MQYTELKKWSRKFYSFYVLIYHCFTDNQKKNDRES